MPPIRQVGGKCELGVSSFVRLCAGRASCRHGAPLWSIASRVLEAMGRAARGKPVDSPTGLAIFPVGAVTAVSLGRAELVAAAGLDHPTQLRPEHFMRRAAPDRVVTFADLYRFLEPGELLAGTDHPRFQVAWKIARADSFAPAHWLVRGPAPWEASTRRPFSAAASCPTSAPETGPLPT